MSEFRKGDVVEILENRLVQDTVGWGHLDGASFGLAMGG